MATRAAIIFATPPADGVGAAATLTVTMTDPSLIAASSDGASGSNGNLANLSAVANRPGQRADADRFLCQPGRPSR